MPNHFELDNILYFIDSFFFFFLHIFVCVFLQKGTRGPPQPLRQRAPPAKMPREVEAHPKPSQRPKGEKSRGGKSRWEAGGSGETWRKDRECLLVVLSGHEDTFAHCRPVWSFSGPNVRLFIGSDCNTGSSPE